MTIGIVSVSEESTQLPHTKNCRSRVLGTTSSCPQASWVALSKWRGTSFSNFGCKPTTCWWQNSKANLVVFDLVRLQNLVIPNHAGAVRPISEKRRHAIQRSVRNEIRLSRHGREVYQRNTIFVVKIWLLSIFFFCFESFRLALLFICVSRGFRAKPRELKELSRLLSLFVDPFFT